VKTPEQQTRSSIVPEGLISLCNEIAKSVRRPSIILRAASASK